MGFHNQLLPFIEFRDNRKGVMILYRLRYYMHRNRYALRRVTNLSACGIIIITLLLGLSYQPVRQALYGSLISLAEKGTDLAFRCSERDPRGLLRAGIPVLAWAGSGEDIPELVTPRSLFSALLAPFRVKMGTPLELVQNEISVLRGYDPEALVVVVDPRENESNQPPSSPGLTEKALVGIYHTHTGETYALSDGTERLTGKRGGVVTAGEALKKELEDVYGMRVAHSTRINDAKYSTSYAESEKDARSLLEDNPEIQILLDIHRDAGKSRQNSLVKVKGQECAPIMFVVGSGARAPFPTWKQNYDFARELADQLEKEYPGLCCGVKVKEGRYNQFLHPRAILVEMGSVSNSTEEAERSARMLAGIIAGKMRDIAPDKVKPAAPGAGKTPDPEQEGVKASVHQDAEIQADPENYEDNNPE